MLAPPSGFSCLIPRPVCLPGRLRRWDLCLFCHCHGGLEFLFQLQCIYCGTRNCLPSCFPVSRDLGRVSSCLLPPPGFHVSHLALSVSQGGAGGGGIYAEYYSTVTVDSSSFSSCSASRKVIAYLLLPCLSRDLGRVSLCLLHPSGFMSHTCPGCLPGRRDLCF